MPPTFRASVKGNLVEILRCSLAARKLLNYDMGGYMTVTEFPSYVQLYWSMSARLAVVEVHSRS